MYVSSFACLPALTMGSFRRQLPDLKRVTTSLLASASTQPPRSSKCTYLDRFWYVSLLVVPSLTRQQCAKRTDVPGGLHHLEEAQRLIHDDSMRAQAADACFHCARILQDLSSNFEASVELCRLSLEMESKLPVQDPANVAMCQRLLAAGLLEMNKFQDALSCLVGPEVREAMEANNTIQISLLSA